MEHVLILTLMIGIGNGGNSAQGSGGMAMHDFPNLESCQNAAAKWKEDSKVEVDSGWVSVNYLTRSAICVPKRLTTGKVVQPTN